MTKLHRITGRAGRCGPSVLSAITGTPTHDCARAIREARGNNRPVFGVGDRDLRAAGRRLGANLERCHGRSGQFNGKDNPTLYQWAREAREGVYVLVVACHFIAVQIDGRAPNRIASVADSMNRKPCTMANANRRYFGPRSRVVQAFRAAPLMSRDEAANEVVAAYDALHRADAEVRETSEALRAAKRRHAEACRVRVAAKRRVRRALEVDAYYDTRPGYPVFSGIR